MRKPHDMSIKEYDARLEELLKWFCDDIDNANSCPRDDQKRELGELTDILYFSIPNKWTKQSIVQGFNTLDKTRDDFVAFCERMEECEQLDGDSNTKTVKKPSAQSGKRKSSDRNDSTYCMLHGKDKGHDSSECKVLMAQAKRMRGMYNSRSEADRAKTRKENRYDNNYKKKPNGKAELHALIAEQVQHKFKQQKAAIGKRKRGKKDLHVAKMPSDVSEQGDDEVSVDDMDQFNFENLKVDISDDNSELDNLSLWANGQIEPITKQMPTQKSSFMSQTTTRR